MRGLAPNNLGVRPMNAAMRCRLVFRSLAFGLLAACVLAAITFLLFPRTHVVTAFIGLGIAVMGVIGRFLPDSFI